MNLILKIAAPLAIIGIGIGSYVLLDLAKPEPDKKVEPPRPLSVYVQTADRADVALQVSAQGEVRSRTDVNLVAQVAGRIVEVSSEFTEGGRIQPGVTLIRIEDIDYRLALSQAQARVAEAEVGVQEAVATADVARKQLRDAANASPLALKQPQVAQARSRLKAAQAELSLAELDLSRTLISLPFEGRIREKQVGVGQYVGPGTVLGRAFATDIVQIRLPLTDDQMASLGLPIGFVAAPLQPILVNLSAMVAGEEHYWQGQLQRLDASIDPRTRTVSALVEVRSPYAENVSQHNMPLAVGLYVKADITGRRISDATVIPRDALRAGNQVFVVNKDSKLEVRTVTVIHSSENEAVIGEGLVPNENVVVSSIRNPIPGMLLGALRPDDASVVAGSQL